MLRAQREAEAARHVAEALEEVLAGADPGSPFGQTSSPQEVLDRGVQQISRRLADRPLVQARLLNTVAWGYRNLGLFSQAEDAVRDPDPARPHQQRQEFLLLLLQ